MEKGSIEKGEEEGRGSEVWQNQYPVHPYFVHIGTNMDPDPESCQTAWYRYPELNNADLNLVFF